SIVKGSPPVSSMSSSGRSEPARPTLTCTPRYSLRGKYAARSAVTAAGATIGSRLNRFLSEPAEVFLNGDHQAVVAGRPRMMAILELSRGRYRFPVGFADSERRNSHSASISSSVICPIPFHGMWRLSSWRPSGVTPLRNVAAKPAFDQRAIAAPGSGVRLAAGGQSGGTPGIFPPENVGPWQVRHELAR